MSQNRRRLLIALSFLVAGGAIWLWWRTFAVSPKDLNQLVARIQWWAVPAIALFLAGHIGLSSWRWTLIEVGIGGAKPRFSHAFAAGGLALGLGTFLPAPVISVICRGLANKLTGNSAIRGAVSGGLDQAADLSMAVLFAIPASFALVLNDFTLYLFGIPLTIVVGLVVVCLLPNVTRSTMVPSRLRAIADLQLFTQRSVLLAVYGISVLRLCNLSLLTLLVHFASGAATIPALLVAVPLATLAISLSMLPGAFGSSEWSFSAILAFYKIDNDEIVAFVLANRILLTSASILIAVLVAAFLASRWCRQPSDQLRSGLDVSRP